MAEDSADPSLSHQIDAKVRRRTLVPGPLLWAIAAPMCLLFGAGWDQAVLRATAFSVSGLVGAIVYLLLRKRSPWSWGEQFFLWNGAAILNLSLLQPKRTPWPFSAMLAHGAIVATIFMGGGALVVRWIKGRQRVAT